MIKFIYDSERATHATLWLLRQHGRLEHIKLLKLIALADLEHLARYGRPIVGGEYFAMEHGVVGSELYDDLKLGAIPGTKCVNDFTLKAVDEPDEEFLSESDLEVLGVINAKYGAWDRYKLSDFTHTFQAWKKNYVEGSRGSFRIPYEDILADLLAEGRLDADAHEVLLDVQQGEHALG